LTPNEKSKPTNDSATEVNPPRNHGVGLWQGRRKVVGIRVDEKLYSAFKPVAQRVFGSVCRPIEAFMASVIAIAESGVNFGETVRIENLHIERNLRSRRKLAIDICGFRGCKEEAVAIGVWRDMKELRLCEKHLLEAKGKPSEWEIVTRD